MGAHFIVMGDIVSSRKSGAASLMSDFTELVASCNSELAEEILSPYTVTLGDEFQGIARSLRSGLHSIFWMEEERIRNGHSFKCRYVVHYGPIDTPINPKIAYEMYGEGLTRARHLLTEKRRGVPRIQIDLPDGWLQTQLMRLTQVADALIGRWKPKDFNFVYDLLCEESDTVVAEKYGKDRSQIWKRRNSLLIWEYQAVKATVLDLAGEEKGRSR
jgi:hypothetical protein